MAVDSVHQNLLLLVAESEDGVVPAQLQVLAFNGTQEAVYPLPALSLQWDAPQVHHFPGCRKLVIVMSPDVESSEALLGQAHIVDVATGQSSVLPLPIAAAFSDVERGRFFVVRGRNLSVVNVASGKIEVTRTFARYIDSLNFGQSGKAYFLQVGFADGSHRLLTLDAPSFNIVQRQVIGRGAALSSLLAVDETQSRMILSHTSKNSSNEEPLTWLAAEGFQGEQTLLKGTEGGEFSLFAPLEPAQALYLHEQSIGQLRIYAREKLGLLQVVDNFYGQFVGFDPDGKLLIVSGKTLQKRNPLSFQIEKSVQLDGFVNFGVYHAQSNRVFLVIEGEQGQQLVCVDLQSLHPVL